MTHMKWILVPLLAGILAVTAIAQMPGDLIWDRDLGGNDDEAFSDVKQTPDGGYVLVGFTETFGATVDFTLAAGASNANRGYLPTGTKSGTSPGTLLPGGLATIPLNRDLVTDFILAHLGPPNFIDFYGVLNAAGEGTAQLVTGPLNPGWVGMTLHFAYALTSPWDFVSNAVAIDVTP